MYLRLGCRVVDFDFDPIVMLQQEFHNLSPKNRVTWIQCQVHSVIVVRSHCIMALYSDSITHSIPAPDRQTNTCPRRNSCPYLSTRSADVVTTSYDLEMSWWSRLINTLSLSPYQHDWITLLDLCPLTESGLCPFVRRLCFVIRIGEMVCRRGVGRTITAPRYAV